MPDEKKRKWQQQYAQRNKAQIKAKNRAYYEANKERIKARNSAWRAANPERMDALRKAWAEANPGDVLERVKRYQATPQGNAVAMCSNAKKRTRNNRIRPAWSDRFVEAEMYALARLRTKLTGIAWHVDHIVPLNSPLVSGLHAHTNLQVVTKSENMRKFNHHWPDMP
jgi:hypothetical protein